MVNDPRLRWVCETPLGDFPDSDSDIQKTGCDGADFAKDVGFHLPALEHAGKIIFSVWSSRLWIDLNRSVLQGHLPRSSNCRCKRFRVRNGAKGTSNHN